MRLLVNRGAELKGSASIVVTGAGGRLGAAMTRDLSQSGYRVAGLKRSDLDISDERAVEAVMDRLRPDVIINCSADNRVDAAQSNPAAAFAANAYGPAALAQAAQRLGAILVHYSSDFVFDGAAGAPYTEEAPTNPLSVYGASKLAGEQEVARADRHYILRLESLFGGESESRQHATVDVIADRLATGGTVRAIVDRTVSPSYVPDVLRITKALLEENSPFGLYHAVSSGSATWYELASEIADVCGATSKVVPVTADLFPTIAPRPRYCALSNQKLVRLGYSIPNWRTTLRQYLATRPTAVRVPVPVRRKTA